MSRGRWGLNVVTGYKKSEFEMFGLEPIEHDFRYEMADVSRPRWKDSGWMMRKSPWMGASGK